MMSLIEASLESILHTSFQEGLSLNNLVQRHYDLSKVLEQEIYPADLIDKIWNLIRILDIPTIRFWYINHHNLFEGINDTHFINHLRRNRLHIQNYRIDLANRSDDTDYRLERDHAMLNDLILLYLFSLVLLSLIYENKIHPESTTRQLISIISDTLTSLK